MLFELEPGEFAGWVRAFAFTELVEVPLYVTALSMLRIERAQKLLPWQRVAVAFLCSLLTHPVVWFAFPRLIDSYEHYVAMVIAAETFAVTAEALVLRFFGVRLFWAVLLSFAVNMTSMSLGFLVRYLIGVI